MTGRGTSARDAGQSGPRQAGKPEKVRFFFALRPDAASAARLAALGGKLAGRHGGRALAAEDIHLTLAFIGLREIGDRAGLERILDGLPARVDVHGPAAMHVPPANGRPPRPVRLERLGTFGHDVLWIGPAAARADCSDTDGFAWPVASAIRDRLRDAGIGFDERPLVLHATLVRGAHAGAPVSGTDRREPVSAIVPHAWSLALGFSGSRAPAGRRYRWSRPMPR